MFAICLLLAFVSGCNQALNEADGLNPDCNYAGTCFSGRCFCCDTTAVNDYCRGAIPGTWAEDTCTDQRIYTVTTWGYLFTGPGVTCVNDGIAPASPDFINEATELIRKEYTAGNILSQPCQVCTSANPCDWIKPPADSGILVRFATDLNSFYHESCDLGNLPVETRECSHNTDNGAIAMLALGKALDDANDYVLHASSMNDLLNLTDTIVDRAYSETDVRVNEYVQDTRQPTPVPTTDPTGVPTPVPSTDPTGVPTPAPTTDPTPAPTPDPTRAPTDPPISIDYDNCTDYVNGISSLKFIAPGASCRANIDESWTGGRTCESPYIICLPQENTPSNDSRGLPFKSDTHRYSVNECLYECSNDQRCLGIEFVADMNSALGDCNLLDDIPIGVEDEKFNFEYDAIENYTNLDNSITGGNALCWAKREYCNPYFEARELNDVMLNCYCPNNRKGFYTKKVKRTVNNTRFCYDDPSVDERIKKAQANRMFHLCENWCLFETSNPEQESWYWDPWKQCFRETYSAVGAHTGYCDRVIRNPDSIELKFVNYRKEHFCDASNAPTSSPVADSNTTWILGEKDESCDDACFRHGRACAAEQTSRRFSTKHELLDAFAESGITCNNVIMESEKYTGWALPGEIANKTCVNRQLTLDHLEDLHSDCNRKIGGNWQRLCACY